MDFALKMGGGHMGPRYTSSFYSILHSLFFLSLTLVFDRKFLREQLPRLKYHNPSIPMIVNRHNVNSRSPIMTIYFRKPDASSSETFTSASQPTSSVRDLSPAQPPTDFERTVTIEMKDKHSSHILDYFIAETRATPVQPTAEDIAEMKYLDATKKQGVLDRERMKRDRMELKKEQDMLKRAREAAGMSDSDGM